MPTHKKQPVPHVQAPRVYQRPEELFRAEKDRSTSAARSLHARLLSEAKAAFDKLMAEGQAARKSGRPRKHPLPPLKTGSAITAANRPVQPFSFVRPSDYAAGVASPPATDDMKAASAAKARAKAKPATKAKAKPKAKAKAKPKAKAKKKK